MSVPTAKPPLAYQFPARPRCTPRRTAHYITETLVSGLVGGCGFGGIVGIIVVLVWAIPAGINTLPSWWNLMLATSPAATFLFGWIGYRTLTRDETTRDDRIVGMLLYILAGIIIGAPVLIPFSFIAWLIGCIIGAVPGIVLWAIYGNALVIFTVRRYSPSMDVAAFRSDARRLAAVTTWLAIGPVGTVLYLLIGDPASTTAVVTAIVLLIVLATITAPFAWWHSKFLIDWWLRDIERSGAP